MPMLVPWQAKLASKVIASNLGIPYSFWRRHGVFKLGAMLNPDYARTVYQHHVSHASQTAQTLLEIGPGDSLFTAVSAHPRFRRKVLIDAGPFAETASRPYRVLIYELRSMGECMPEVEEHTSSEGLLNALHCRYLINGIASFSDLQDGEIDFSFSHSCLQHIPLAEFQRFSDELYRVTSPDGGTGSHLLDFRDMLAGSLNHLRFPNSTWESGVVRRANIYTNRLGIGQVKCAFENSGFNVEIIERKCWDTLPISKASLNREFRSMDDQELLVYGCHLILRKGATHRESGELPQ
ncbi:class I SAM-dependent methyltransferase [Caballeronia sp. NK8]|uniref:class I SAM-dependent methyltransferase n=1 Tax=Caballeronia sp. NK8 TaxID=140098 RepID=UPI001BCB7176|nr:class I SAM-dependent methyltransferase [Caballeronia sp. NK8]